MQHYNEQELDTKIDTFLTKKLQKYPELDTKLKTTQAAIESSVSAHLRASFTWFKPLATR